MKTILSSLLLSFVLTAASTALAADTATLSASSTTYSPKGGVVTFTVSFNYSGPIAAIGFSAAAPAGWSFSSLGGTNPPAIVPRAGDEGEFAFAYMDIPPSPASFMFTVAYPAGLTGNQTLTGIKAIFRSGDSNAAQTVTLPDLVLAPAP